VDDESLNTVGGHCPTCGQEYRPGFTVCADDGTELVPGPAPEPEPDGDDDEGAPGGGSARTDVADLTSEHGPPVELGAFPAIDAVLLAGRLRSLGIPATADSDVNDSPYRNAPGMSGLSRVFVRPEDFERAHAVAQRILERANDTDDDA
jgi:hypothetical protein